MIVTAIDPGPKQSAYAVMDGKTILYSGKIPNDELIQSSHLSFPDQIAIEMIACYGMAVGAEVFDTCVWIGRFTQASASAVSRVFRKDVKIHLCNSMKAKDANIRQAIIDIYGGSTAIGTKKEPGPLRGVAGDVWAAIGVGLTFQRVSK